MPRALWSGSLSFGLVNVPVQLVSAARDLDYHFHQLHEKDKARIEQRLQDPPRLLDVVLPREVGAVADERGVQKHLVRSGSASSISRL